MAKIGTKGFDPVEESIEGLTQQLTLAGLTGESVSGTRQNKRFEKILNNCIEYLKEGESLQDPFLAFRLERSCILFEKAFFGKNPQEQKRLDKQLSENGAAAFSAKLVFDPEKYSQHVREVYGPNRKVMFPPAGESCVTVPRKQIQYLARPKSGMTADKIKEFYTARQKNLHCALDLCIAAQCKALDIPMPKQAKAKRLEL